MITEPVYLITASELDSLDTREKPNPDCEDGFNHGSKRLGLANWERKQIVDRVISRGMFTTNNTPNDIVVNLLQMHCRNVINTDKSGLAFGLARCKQIAEGYNWIPRGEWGDYDCDHRTVATLQKEVGYMIEELVETCERALRESGERVNVNIKEVETAIAELGEKKT